MMINWKVRVKNKMFWIGMISSVLLLIQAVLDVFGIHWDFGDLGNRLTTVVNAVFVLLTVLGVVVDPTTEGAADSVRALGYTEPWSDSQAIEQALSADCDD